MAQLEWVPRHRADIESDLSAVHRVDDIESMPSAKYFRLAWRLPHYRGVMRDRALAEQSEQGSTRQAPERAASRQAAPVRTPPRRDEPVTEAVLADPVMSKIFSFG